MDMNRIANEMNDEVLRLRARIAELEAELIPLRQDHENAVLYVDRLEAEVATLKAELDTCRHTEPGATAVIKELEAQRDQLAARLEALRQKAHDWVGHESLRDDCNCRSEIGQEILGLLR